MKWVAEYSVEQKCWNIAPLDNVLTTNLRMISNKISNDYKILCIGSYEKCQKFIKLYKEISLDEG